MPNWTTNRIKVHTGACDLHKYESVAESGERYFDFEKIIPSPKTKEECIKKYGIEYITKENTPIQTDDDKPWFNWYEWNYEFWGTKWNACYSTVSEDGFNADFDTAWAEPTPIFEEISKQNPECTFVTYADYEDGGVHKCVWEKGECVEEF